MDLLESSLYVYPIEILKLFTMKKLFFTAVFMMALVFSASAQDREPAMAKKPAKKTELQTQGYIKNTPSNTSQEKQLKKLNAEEKKAYAPKPKAKKPKKKGTVIDY